MPEWCWARGIKHLTYWRHMRCIVHQKLFYYCPLFLSFRSCRRCSIQHDHRLPLAQDSKSSWSQQLCPLWLWGWWKQWVHHYIHLHSQQIPKCTQFFVFSRHYSPHNRTDMSVYKCLKCFPLCQPPSTLHGVRANCQQTSAWRLSGKRSQNADRVKEECFRE